MTVNIDLKQNNIVNLSCYRGDAFGPLEVEITNEDEELVDLSGFTAKMEVRERPGSEVVEAFEGDELTLGVGVINIFKTEITAPGGSYKYDLQIDKDGLKTTIFKGNFTIYDDISI